MYGLTENIRDHLSPQPTDSKLKFHTRNHLQLVLLVGPPLIDEQFKIVHEYNFGHPDAFNTELLLSGIGDLKHGKVVRVQTQEAGRLPAHMVNPTYVIILEGIRVLHNPGVLIS